MASHSPAEIVEKLRKFTGYSASELIYTIARFSVSPKEALIVTAEMLEAAYNYGRDTAIAESIAKEAITAAKTD